MENRKCLKMNAFGAFFNYIDYQVNNEINK